MFKNKSNTKPSLGSTINTNHPLAQGLIGCWLFNEQTGNKIYDLSKDNHMGFFNGADWKYYNNSVKLDGTNDFIQTSKNLDLTGNASRSICIWFYIETMQVKNLCGYGQNDTGRIFDLITWSAGGYNRIIGHYYGTNFDTESTLPSRNTIKVPGWNQVVHMYDGTKVSIYTNGVFSNSKVLNLNTLNSSLNIGKGTYNPYDYFGGDISQVSVYNRALSAEEVLSLYEQPYQFIDPPAALKYYSYSQHRSLLAPSIKSEEISKIHSLDNGLIQSYNIQKFYKNLEISFDDSNKFSSSIKIYKPASGQIYQVGSSGNSTYTYRISAIDKFNNETDTLVITTNTANSSLDSINYNKITWAKSQYAFRYKIYGRTSGNELYIDSTYDNCYDDIGKQTLNISYPLQNLTGYNKNNLTLGRYWDIENENQPFYIKSISENKIFPMFDDLTTGAYVLLIDVLKYNDRYNLIFGSKESSIRRIVCYRHDKYNNTFQYIGNIVITFQNSNARAIIDIRSTLYSYSTGFVSVLNNTVTGFNTDFLSTKFSAGARIGFGSCDSTKISKWYEISSFDSSTSLTILNSTESLNNTFYVIEEFRLIIPYNNTTLGKTELFLFKGLHTEDFKNLFNYTIANDSDNTKNYYSLTETNNLPYNNGIALEPKTSEGEHNLYLWTRPTTTTLYIHKYNILQDLVVSSGVSSSAFIFRCGGNLTIPATQYTYMALAYSVPRHNPYLNRPILTLSFIDRILNIPIDKLEADKENIFEYYNDAPLVNYYNALNLWSNQKLNLDYCEMSDRFVFMNRVSQTFPSYMGKLGSYDKYAELFIFTDTRINSLPIMPKGIPNIPSYSDFEVRCCDGYSYFVKGSSQNDNTIFSIPFSGDSKFADESKNYCITPVINTNRNIILKSFSYKSTLTIGEDYYEYPLEALVFYYRISDFDDESSSWVRIQDFGKIDINVDGEIQFKIETKINELTLNTKKLYNIILQYEDIDNLPFGFSWNLNDTNKEAGVIGFIQNKLINKYPSFSINIFRKSDNKIIFSQSSDTNSNGEFQYYQGTWLRGFGPDQINLRRRYVFNDVLPKNVEYIVRLRMN
jgi:hypothetical protein